MTTEPTINANDTPVSDQEVVDMTHQIELYSRLAVACEKLHGGLPYSMAFMAGAAHAQGVNDMLLAGMTIDEVSESVGCVIESLESQAAMMENDAAPKDAAIPSTVASEHFSEDELLQLSTPSVEQFIKDYCFDDYQKTLAGVAAALGFSIAYGTPMLIDGGHSKQDMIDFYQDTDKVLSPFRFAMNTGRSPL